MTAMQFDARFLDRLRDAFAAQLPGFLPVQRWFGSKAHRIQGVELADCVPVKLQQATALMAFAAVRYDEIPAETYVLPLLWAPNERRSEGAERARVVTVPDRNSPDEVVLTDACEDAEFLSMMVRAIQGGISYVGSRGELQANATTVLAKLLPGTAEPPAGRRMKGEQSNTSVIFGESVILKLFRRVTEGTNPDLEIGLFLTEKAHFRNVPPLAGALEYPIREGKSMSVGMRQEFVPKRGDAWRHKLASLGHYLSESFSRFRRGGDSENELPAFLAGRSVPADLAEIGHALEELIGLLGRRTAELHIALASGDPESDFSPEPFTAGSRESLKRSIHDLVVQNFGLLRAKAGSFPDDLRELAGKALELEDDVLLACHSALDRGIRATCTRIHGDYHLGQVLFTGDDFFIIDFEGEPARPLAERRAKRSPLQDVAGMLRSLQYAARAALLSRQGPFYGGDRDSQILLERLAGHWQTLASARFLADYRETAKGASFLPADPREFDALLRVHLLEKAVYELGYELNNRPEWLRIPLRGIQELAGGGRP